MPSLTYRTLANFRTSTSATVGAPYYLNEPGKEGMFCYVGLTDKKDDGGMTLVGPKGRTYIRILSDNTILLRWYDIIPDRPDLATQNSLRLDAVIKAFNYMRLLLQRWVGQANVYSFNHVPGSGAFDPNSDTPCINFCDKVMTFEFEPGVVAETETGHVGLRNYSRYAPAYLVLRRVSLRHAGGRESVKEHGALRDEKGELQVDKNGRLVYSTSWGADYKIHGIQYLAAGEWHGVNVYGYPGHGACVWGDNSVRLPAAYEDIKGRIRYFNGDALFVPDDQADALKMNVHGGAVTLGDQPTRQIVGGGADNVSLSYGTPQTTGLKEGAEITARYGRTTQPFYCDFIQARPLDGLNNFDACGGMGVYVVGPEANAGDFQAISCRDNGAWGIGDFSFLGNDWKHHITTCGNRHNYEGYTPIGGLTTGDNPNTSATFQGYCEQGMGPNVLSGNATENPGFNLNGVRGGKSMVNGRLQGFYWAEG